jgi:putative protease
MMAEQLIGRVTHYFGKAGVAAIEISAGELHVGDTIHVKGHTTDFAQTVDSIQIDRQPVEVAKVGDAIGIRVPEHAREHDDVYKVLPD